MRSLDEILEFLFHTKAGKAICTCAVAAVPFVSGGCMLFDTLDCICSGGSESNPSCWGAIDDECNDLLACGGDCDNTILTGLFGEGCEKDCGDCGTWFYSCNPSDCEIGGDCGGDDANCSFFGCNVTCGDPAEKIEVAIEYIDVNSKRQVGTKYWSIWSNSSWTYIENDYLTPPNSYILKGGFYLNYDNGEFSNQYAERTGEILMKDKNPTQVSVLYVPCEEMYFGDRCDLTFYATVDGESADGNASFYDFDLPKCTAYVGMQLVDFPTPLIIDGYTFEGWFFNGQQKELENGKYFHLYEFTSTGTPSLAIEARYTSTKLQISLGGTNYTVPYGSSLKDFMDNNQVNLESEEGRFAGFYVTHGEHTEYYVEKSAFDAVRIEENTTLRAKYDAPVLLEYYNYYGLKDERIFTEEEQHYQNESYQLLTKPEFSTIGVYTFAGWYKEPECENEWTQSILLSETSYKFYAKWNSNTEFEIGYYRNETETNPFDIKSYEYSETETVSLMTAEELGISIETGYTFAGWYNMDDPEKTVLTELPAGTSGNLKLCLKKVPVSYEITLNANHGSVSPEKQTISYGEKFALPVPTREGYDFQGWYNLTDPSTLLTDETGKSIEKFTPANVNASKFQFYAKWEIHIYKVTFVNGDGTQTEKDCQYGNSLGEVNITPTEKTGHEFLGWFNGEEEYSAEKQIKADCTYTAKYKPKTYTITLDAGDGSVNPTTITVEYGKKVELPVPESREGFAFNGWSYNGSEFADFEGEMVSEYLFTEGITVHAVWIQL